MKICPKNSLLLTTKCSYLIVRLLISSIMVALLLESTFHRFSGVPFVVDAKCVHDDLNAPVPLQSTQTYDNDVQPGLDVDVTTVPAIEEISTVDVKSTEEQGYEYYYDYKWETRITTSERTHDKHEPPMVRRRRRSSKHRCRNRAHKVFRRRHRRKRQMERNDISTQVPTIPYFVGSYIDEKQLDDLFKPLRLKIWYDSENMAFSNQSKEFFRLQVAVERAKEAISKILSVIPVSERLLLSRHDICSSYYSTPFGVKGKCARFNNYYSGEECLGFKIPDDHLEGFSTYDTSNIPHNYFLDGEGLEFTDTVIYIGSKQQSHCNTDGVFGFSMFCRLDQCNRPLAGYANFCPKALSSDDFNWDSFYLTVLHEFFHILGFSSKLFDKFQKYSKMPTAPGDTKIRFECKDQGNVVEKVGDHYKISSPAVGRESDKHFNCSDIKGPLEGTGSISSHWESRYLQPSIMTASLGLAHLTVLDRITLAVFEDSGWYKVDFTQAQNLTWGKEAGCDFASQSYCSSGENPYFCTSNSLMNGCHYLHLDKGVCEKTQFLENCKIYKPSRGSECWIASNQTEEGSQHGEVYNINSRCFISNLSALQTQDAESSQHREKREVAEEGRCYEHRCNDSRTLEIRVRGASWVVCPTRGVVKIPGYGGSIRCPSSRQLCSIKAPIARNLKGPKSCATVNISFKDLYKWLGNPPNRSKATDFVDRLKKVIQALPKMNGTAILGQAKMRSISVSFQLTTIDGAASKFVCGNAVTDLKVRVLNRTFFVQVATGRKIQATAIFVRYTLHACDGEPGTEATAGTGDQQGSAGHSTQKDSPKGHPPPGTIAAMAVGAVCVTVLSSVGGLLYWKSTIPRSIGPTSVSAIEVAYNNPSNRPSITTGSESGSVGQIEFPV